MIGLIEVDPSPPSVHYNWSWGGTVTIVTKSGAIYTSTVDAPRGSGPRGIEWSDVEAKYRALLPDSKLPVAVLRYPKMDGPTKPPRLPTELMVPIAVAAAAFPRYAVGTVHSTGSHA